MMIQCKMCQLPEEIRDEVDEMDRKGQIMRGQGGKPPRGVISTVTVVKWLTSLGYEVSDTSVKRHLDNHVLVSA